MTGRVVHFEVPYDDADRAGVLLGQKKEKKKKKKKEREREREEVRPGVLRLRPPDQQQGDEGASYGGWGYYDGPAVAGHVACGPRRGWAAPPAAHRRRQVRQGTDQPDDVPGPRQRLDRRVRLQGRRRPIPPGTTTSPPTLTSPPKSAQTPGASPPAPPPATNAPPSGRTEGRLPRLRRLRGPHHPADPHRHPRPH